MRFKAEVFQLYDEIKRESLLPPRVMMARRKRELLEDGYKRYQLEERRALELMRRPDYTNLHPVLVPCARKDRSLWQYVRQVVSSAPDRGILGRQIQYLCVDQNTGGILGALRLNSDLNMLGVRDQLIGWTKERKFNGGLNMLANMGTCIAVAPFGRLTGGKFMSVAATSKEVVESYERRYRTPLAALLTTSLFGKSSQYNRMKEWELIGYTQGRGSFQLGLEVRKHLKRIYHANKDILVTQGNRTDRATWDRVNLVFGKAKLKLEGLSAEQPRGIYFAPLGPNTIPMLLGESSHVGGTRRTQREITEWWNNRWYQMRLRKFESDVTNFDFSCYGLSAQIDLCKCVGSIDSDASVFQTVEAGATPVPALHGSHG